jgi:pyroglutamyl-peptidase
VSRPRILITGFGPFPGAPFNPTQPLVARLVRTRRPALGDVSIAHHVFDVSYAAVDRDLPELIRRHRPDAILMFGVATRTPFLRVETRARNTVTALWPDAAGMHAGRCRIDAGLPAALGFGMHVLALPRAARVSGITAKLSHNAGRYLCNYLSFRAIMAAREADGPRLVAFIHVPPVARIGLHHGARGRTITMRDLERAGDALVMAVVGETRRRLLARPGGHDDHAQFR